MMGDGVDVEALCTGRFKLLHTKLKETFLYGARLCARGIVETGKGLPQTAARLFPLIGTKRPRITSSGPKAQCVLKLLVIWYMSICNWVLSFCDHVLRWTKWKCFADPRFILRYKTIKTSEHKKRKETKVALGSQREIFWTLFLLPDPRIEVICLRHISKEKHAFQKKSGIPL